MLRSKSIYRLVTDGEEFLDYLYQRPPWETAERPDLILLDLNMPRMNGCEALRQIKAQPDLASIPVVVLTTSKDPADVLDAYARGQYLRPEARFVRGSGRDYLGTMELWFGLCVVPGVAER